jgi:hypothetical protein
LRMLRLFRTAVAVRRAVSEEDVYD